MGTGNRLKVRLFIEGIECPVIAVQVQAQPNGPAHASIQIPPTDLATRLLPRSCVHIFFLDRYEQANPYLTLKGNDRKNIDRLAPTPYEQARRKKQEGAEDAETDEQYANDVKNVRYKLLFAGELFGYQWSKTPTSRSIVLQCMDMSNYWDYAYQFNNTDLFGPGLKAVFSGGATNLLTDFLSSPGEIVASLIHQRSVNYPGVQGLLGGLIRLLEAIGGSYYTGDKFVGQNIFFSLAELRLRVTQMITAFPDDPTVTKLMGAGSYDGLFGRTLGNLGEQVSIRTALNALMGVVFHETYPIPTPLFVPGTGGTQSGEGRKPISKISKYFSIYSAVVLSRQALKALKDIILQPLSGSDAPLDASAASNKAAFMTRYANMRKAVRAALVEARQKKLEAAVAPLTLAVTALDKGYALANKDWQPGSFPGKKQLAIVETFNRADEQLKRVEGMEAATVEKKQQAPSRLNTQIFKPDIWFGPPPRCNVIFPDQYMQFQYARSFMQEPTRFLLKTHNEFFGEDELFDSFYFAPRIRTVKGKKKSMQQLFGGDIMEHEVFTGILPVFEKMGEMNIFAVRSGQVKGKTPKVGLAQRSANFLYFKHRFAARQASVSCVFNPYLATGFPCLVLDRYVDVERVEQYVESLRSSEKLPLEAKNFMGSHFLGSIVELSHSLNQQQGTTDVRLGFAREYDEVTDFFGPSIKEDQEVLKQVGDDATRIYAVAALSKPPLNSIGLNYGVIERVSDVSGEYDDPDPLTAAKLPLFSVRRAGTDRRVEVLVGPTLPAAEHGSEVTKLVGDARKPVKFKAYEITEKIPRYRREKVDLPTEELIRPGWYADIWHPARIGEPYNFYLGTGSITDKTQVSDPDGMPSLAKMTGNPNTEETDALSKRFDVPDDKETPFNSAVAMLQLDEESSTEQAVQFLLLVYSYARRSGANIDEFIRTYTWRPIATMVDMFGSSDLQLSADGTTVVRGIEGFHSRAFGPYRDLFGLVNDEITEVLGIKRNDSARQVADVRGPRFDAAAAMIKTLVATRAWVGLLPFTTSKW